MAIKRFIPAAVLACMLALTYCDLAHENKQIAPKLIGKWEITSITRRVLGYTQTFILPDPNAAGGISSAGYKFTAFTYTYFADGSVYQQFSGVYSEGEKIYTSTDQSFGWAWKISGDTLTIEKSDSFIDSSTIVCKKVLQFSWE